MEYKHTLNQGFIIKPEDMKKKPYGTILFLPPPAQEATPKRPVLYLTQGAGGSIKKSKFKSSLPSVSVLPHSSYFAGASPQKVKREAAKTR